jgi:hypothetical protein
MPTQSFLLKVSPTFVALALGFSRAVWAQGYAQQGSLMASDGAANNYFGSSVAIAGNTAVVGAPGKTVGSNAQQGAAYVYTFNGSSWVQQAELTASDGTASDSFGRSVAISGNTVVVGAPYASLFPKVLQGSAYAYKFGGTSWALSGKLTAPDAANNDYFGSSVAISGSTAVVGAYGKTIGANTSQGAAYLYTSLPWVERVEFTASNGAAYDEFGISVAISGNTAVVGAYGKTIGANTSQGAAYVYASSNGGNTWAQQAELTASNGATNDLFGSSVAISGNTALVGAQGKTVGPNSAQGAAYVYTFNVASWVQQAELTANDGAMNDAFGVSVAISGNTALVGAPGKSTGPNSGQGAAYVYLFNGSSWVQQAKLIASDGAANDALGQSVGISGNSAVVGAPNKSDASNPSRGAAYVFAPAAVAAAPALPRLVVFGLAAFMALAAVVILAKRQAA